MNENEINGLPLYNIGVEDVDGIGLDLVSFVDSPAIGENWITLSQYVVKLATDDEKRVVTGPALIPDLPIYRGDHYIQFSREQIERIAQKFFKDNAHLSTNINHKGEKFDGVVAFESWIVGDEDKSNQLGWSVVPGTWMLSYKVDNERLWGLIKAGEVKGFSIEGNLMYNKNKKELTKASKEEYVSMLSILKSISYNPMYSR
jgi:hypothetical protein